MKIRLLLVLIGIALSSSPAWAFWYGTSPSGGVDLKDKPSGDSAVLRNLPQGTRFSAVDQPYQGYYRVRTATETGWIEASLVDSQNPKSTGAVTPPPAPEPVEPAPTPTPTPTPRAATKRQAKRQAPTKKYKGPRWELRGFMDLAFYKMTTLDSALGTTDLDGGVGFGGEIAYRSDPDWAFALRAETLGKTVSGQDASQNNDSYALKATAITFGPDYYFTDGPGFSLRGSGRVGWGKPSLTATLTNTSVSDSTVYSSSGLAALFDLVGTIKLGETFGITADVGYRFLKASQVNPSPVNTASSFNSNAAVDLDFGGLFAGAGLSIAF